MKIFVTGGTGFVGSALLPHLIDAGHTVRLLVRPGERTASLPGGVEVVEGDSTARGPWWNGVAGCQAAVNLAGAPIFGRWTEQKKRLIRDSRILTTRNLVEAIPASADFTLVSTSAVGIYGNAGERTLDESAPLGQDFLARLAQEWEEGALRAKDKGARVVVTRFAVVLGPGGGALEQLLKVTNSFIGGPLGSGQQWFSWIHREDLSRAVRHLLEGHAFEGVFNLSSPNPARQIDVARVLGKLLGRPAAVPAPAFAVRLLLGEFADSILFSQRMVPKRLSEAGFEFHYPELEAAVREVLSHRNPPPRPAG